jgi:hypothetical protein
MMLSFLGFSQNPSLIRTNLSPGGMLDNIFDGNGNRYNLNDVMYQSSRVLSNGSLSTTTLQENAGYFRLFFENGCGMEGSSAIEIQRRAIVIQVFNDISNFIPSPLTTNGLNNKVNIWVRNITNIPNVQSSALGLATAFYNLPHNDIPGFGGIADNEIWKTIHLGKDSYTNVAPPIITNSDSNSGISGLFYHGMIAFNFTSFVWNTNLGVLANGSQFDLYTVVLHEVIHALGFVSLINKDGFSIFNSGFNYFSRYDRFLKNNSNTASLITNTGNCLLYNYSFNPNSSLITPAVLRPTCTLPNNINTGNSINTTITSNALRFIGSTLTNLNIPIYTPICFEVGSSLSHFEDTNFTPPTGFGFITGNDLYFTMSNANGMGTNKRYPKREERLALLELGYSVSNSFGLSSTLQGVPPVGYYNTSATGITVAGINDGILTNNTYTYIGNATIANPIIINSPTDTSKQILLNDTGATGFECLEDTTDSNAIFSATSGSISTNVTFSSAIAGLHLLRYVPYNSTGKGNITYIYVYVNSTQPAFPSSCLPTPSVFNLVMNGNFEQYSALPDGPSQLERACGWYSIYIAQPSNEYYNANAIITNPLFSFSVPCNIIGYQTVNNGNGNSYAGLGQSQNYFNLNLPYTEVICTKLQTPLAPNTTYQVSFDVSLAEGASAAAMKFQIYLSELPIYTSSPVGYMPISDLSLVKESLSYLSTTNGWEKIIINVTTGTSPLQYLYLGAINNTQFQSRVPENASLNGCNYYTDYNVGAFAAGKHCYYYLDNVALIPLNGASFVLPTTVCPSNLFLPNLANYLVSCPTNGIFSGNGVSYNPANGLYSFQFPNGVTSSTITYTFTNNLGYSISLQSTIAVANITPTFNPIQAFCQGGIPPVLPTTSTNGILGTWSPSTVSNTASGNYTFTPTVGQCATTASVTTTVTTATITPTFNTIPVLCQGSTPPVLPTTSTNGITGTWSPATISTAASGNYTFTPAAGQCGNAISVAVQVLSNTAFVTNTDDLPVTFWQTTAPITTNSVLLNDTYNGGAVPATIPGIPYSIVLTGTPPTIPVGSITFNATTGTFTVASNTTPGTYVYQYYLQTNCYVTPTRTIKIVVNRFTGESRIGFGFCFNNTSSTPSSNSSTRATNLFSGIRLNGVQTNGTNSTIVLVAPTTTLPPQVTQLTTNGTFTIPVGTLPGTYYFYYRICSSGFCTGTIECQIQIDRTFMANADTVTAAASGAITYNVLSNDVYKGTCSSTSIVPATVGSGGNVTLTQVAPFSSYYNINSSGTLIPNGSTTPAPGSSIILNYQLCDQLFPSICQTVSVLITIPSAKYSDSDIPDVNLLDTIILYPNPNQGQFTVSFESPLDTGTIEVFSLVGQRLAEVPIDHADQVTVQLPNLAAGCYLVKVTSNGQTIQKRIIIE